MNVGGLPSHRVQHAELGVRAAQGREFDARAVRTKATNDPASAQLDKRIGAAYGTIEDGLVENFGGALVLLRLDCFRPAGRRLDKRFRLASDASPVPIGDGDIAGVAQTTQSGDAVREAIRDAGCRHEMFNGIDGADGHFGL